MHRYQKSSEEIVFGGLNKRPSITIYTYAKLPTKFKRKACFTLRFEIKSAEGQKGKVFK